MDEQLSEARSIIGLKEEKIEKFVQEDAKKTEIGTNRDLSDAEYEYLSKVIPNGRLLNFKYISTGFGFRTHPITKRKNFHSALDLSADMGTEIFAPADGVVVYAGEKKFYDMHQLSP